MSEKEIEKEIQDKGLTAPRLTPEYIDGLVDTIEYYVFPGTTMTICLIILRNGFKICGEADCVSAENFDQRIGQKIAFQNARDKIWMLEGYLLKDILANEKSGE